MNLKRVKRKNFSSERKRVRRASLHFQTTERHELLHKKFIGSLINLKSARLIAVIQIIPPELWISAAPPEDLLPS
ncbi:hypothetical protein ILYODFUR_020809 [Ilyodon furcidens]|uniref:Uncharacterized protein n=1 Tax=Ilyodon furcidens TaxID=33524 RepID=A0ABV0SYU4_9TELE